jgi:hypothetical protein
MEALRTKTYILEGTRDFFAGRPNEPYSGAARLEPADSGAAPLRSVVSTVALRSPNCLGADPPTSATARIDPWSPPVTREM